MEQFRLNTSRENFYNITASVRESVRKSGLQDGLCLVYCPHTTAGITINENTDPDVISDLLLGLEQAFPDRDSGTWRATPPPISRPPASAVAC